LIAMIYSVDFVEHARSLIAMIYSVDSVEHARSLIHIRIRKLKRL
jgi:hypothetical protein